MVGTRNTDSRLEALEKVTGDLEKGIDSLHTTVGDLKVQSRTTDDRVAAIASQLELFIAEMCAALPAIKSTDETGSNSTKSADSSETATKSSRGNRPCPCPRLTGRKQSRGWLGRSSISWCPLRPSRNGWGWLWSPWQARPCRGTSC